MSWSENDIKGKVHFLYFSTASVFRKCFFIVFFSNSDTAVEVSVSDRSLTSRTDPVIRPQPLAVHPGSAQPMVELQRPNSLQTSDATTNRQTSSSPSSRSSLSPSLSPTAGRLSSAQLSRSNSQSSSSSHTNVGKLEPSIQMLPELAGGGAELFAPS